MRRLLLGAALLGLLTVACEAQLNLEVQLEPDGSGVVIAETGFDEEFEELVFSGTDPAEAIFDDNALAEFPGSEFSTYEEGIFTFYRITVPFTDVNAVLNQAADDVPLEGVTIDVTDDQIRVEAQVPDVSDRLTGGDEQAEGFEGFDASLFEDVLTVHIRLTLPGEVIEHNADRVLDGGTLEWDVSLTEAPPFVSAVADLGGGGSGGLPVWAIVLIAIGGLAALVVIALAVAGRRDGVATDAEDALVTAPAVPDGGETPDAGQPPPPPTT